MSEEDLTNYKTYISDLDITKYIVLDNESNYWYSAKYVDKMLKKQDKEIERLNNIINKAIDFLKENACIDDNVEYFCDDLRYDDCKKLLDILKGDDKE